MQPIRRVLFAALIALPGLAAAQENAAAPNLTVLADDSLMLVAAELSRAYSTQSGVALTVIGTRGADPANQLEQGFEAHVLLSPDPTLIDRLAQRGLIDVYGTQPFAATQLALVAPQRMRNRLDYPERLALAKRISFAALLFSQPDLPVYVNDPSTVGGMRAEALMSGREFSHELAQRAQVKTSADSMTEALDAQDGFALMLASNAVAEPGLDILNLLPEATSKPVQYNAAVIASEAMGEARGFTKFLRSKQAQAILAHYGFQPMS